MQCLGEIATAICGGPGGPQAPAIVPGSALPEVEAGIKLMLNFEKVVWDITNTGACGIGGGQKTQPHLKRVDPEATPHVQAMVRAACCHLLGRKASGPSSHEEALVWLHAAKFLGVRIQATEGACPGRAADMPPAQAAAMRAVLGRIEAASKQN
eukprot:gnl/TRDRNA2_/TRDRNA2_175933_c0_seq7.p1 gnl/TRDRNA2_/TRDRNA2_175933_c0~~gnl/TRDRNA2_/TRDRNA2_175933_c0_seq7.p1  ORF type:complete len:178 (-),score=18.23 gnl/TRDRNA2_/TRDRNA2_175933_c0_seq7:16-477(-)